MTTNTTQKKSGFDNIKNIGSNVVSTAKQAQASITSVRKQFATLTEAIANKQAQFKQVALEDNVAKSTIVVPEITPEVAKSVKTAKALVVEAPTQQESDPIVNTPKTTVEVSQKPITPKPTEQSKSETPTPKTTVITKIENGREVKTYTDEKGNVKVRKFLDMSSPRKPSPPTTANSSRPNQPGSRPYGNQPYNRNNAPTNRPFGNKDDNSSVGRPQGYRPSSVPGKHPTGGFTAPVEFARPQDQRQVGNKNKTHDKPEDKRSVNKKNLLVRNFADPNYDDDRVVRRAKKKNGDNKQLSQTIKIIKAVIATQEVPVKVLSERIGVSASEIIKQLFKENVFKTINDNIDYDTAEYIASMYDVTLELKIDKTAEDIIAGAEEDDGLANDTKRPPIVTVMGHVDHGKTSLLDAIRNTSVTSGEAGGITQHIGAYTVFAKNEPITFIDTPGHAAFTAMRARGAKVTDVAIIVVAADDGVMPQTVEAINHAKAAGVSIVVAINKMDKVDINVDRILTQLSEQGLLSEQWGGDTIMVPVSAKSGLGLDKLLESVLLVTELKELKANPNKRAIGTVIESKLDKGRGVVATVLVSNGTLSIGDNVIAGLATGKIRAMFDDKGKRVKSAGPSIPVEVLGFSEVPDAGDFMYVADEKLVRKAAEERKNKIKIESSKQAPSVSLGDLFGRISEGQLKTLNIIIKTDVQGSLEALRTSLVKISNDEVRVNAIHGGVGAINETDIMLARASEAIIIGFNVRADSNAKIVAEKEGVDVRLYNVIYDAVDDVTNAMKGMLTPKFKENQLGSVDIREVFRITGVGTVAGCYVTSGKVLRNCKVRVYRNDVSVYDGNIMALKRFKDDVKEVASGYECGISIENYNDLKVGDILEVYQMEEIKQ